MGSTRREFEDEDENEDEREGGGHPGEKLFDNGPINTYRSVGLCPNTVLKPDGRSSGRR
jgi:hypothetical protein